ncbi:MAG: biotin-dependent carboxyltransferase family protein [Oscillospiraceae bacterium]|jgi:biotin-dependent carboxylase-like uncharacterized protein|nr:biotin-dependent carboxyltransferase family protein [Oscillospiraceae bacterium]
MGMTILAPGPLTTVQDLGRTGWLAAGFCPSGAMDIPAARLANALAGNPPQAAVLEMTFSGLSARFTADCRFALTGADMGFTLSGAPVTAYTALAARAGDELRGGAASTGCRTYLAVSGGVDVPPVMGSRATHIKCGIGGFLGRALRAGDVLSFGVPQTPVPAPGTHLQAPPPPGGCLRVRVTLGPQWRAFDKRARAAFLSAVYTVSPQSDRMGMRLEGPVMPSIRGTDIVSDAIPIGAIQVPASGQPIILLADRQTVGGYAKPWVVIGPDIPLLAQARPGDALRFALVSPRQAARAARRGARALDQAIALVFLRA